MVDFDADGRMGGGVFWNIGNVYMYYEELNELEGGRVFVLSSDLN